MSEPSSMPPSQHLQPPNDIRNAVSDPLPCKPQSKGGEDSSREKHREDGNREILSRSLEEAREECEGPSGEGEVPITHNRSTLKIDPLADLGRHPGSEMHATKTQESGKDGSFFGGINGLPAFDGHKSNINTDEVLWKQFRDHPSERHQEERGGDMTRGNNCSGEQEGRGVETMDEYGMAGHSRGGVPLSECGGQGDQTLNSDLKKKKKKDESKDIRKLAAKAKNPIPWKQDFTPFVPGKTFHPQGGVGIAEVYNAPFAQNGKHIPGALNFPIGQQVDAPEGYMSAPQSELYPPPYMPKDQPPTHPSLPRGAADPYLAQKGLRVNPDTPHRGGRQDSSMFDKFEEPQGTSAVPETKKSKSREQEQEPQENIKPAGPEKLRTASNYSREPVSGLKGEPGYEGEDMKQNVYPSTPSDMQNPYYGYEAQDPQWQSMPLQEYEPAQGSNQPLPAEPFPGLEHDQRYQEPPRKEEAQKDRTAEKAHYKQADYGMYRDPASIPGPRRQLYEEWRDPRDFFAQPRDLMPPGEMSQGNPMPRTSQDIRGMEQGMYDGRQNQDRSPVWDGRQPQPTRGGPPPPRTGKAKPGRGFPEEKSGNRALPPSVWTQNEQQSALFARPGEPTMGARMSSPNPMPGHPFSQTKNLSQANVSVRAPSVYKGQSVRNSERAPQPSGPSLSGHQADVTLRHVSRGPQPPSVTSQVGPPTPWNPPVDKQAQKWSHVMVRGEEGHVELPSNPELADLEVYDMDVKGANHMTQSMYMDNLNRGFQDAPPLERRTSDVGDLAGRQQHRPAPQQRSRHAQSPSVRKQENAVDMYLEEEQKPAVLIQAQRRIYVEVGDWASTIQLLDEKANAFGVEIRLLDRIPVVGQDLCRVLVRGTWNGVQNALMDLLEPEKTKAAGKLIRSGLQWGACEDL